MHIPIISPLLESNRRPLERRKGGGGGGGHGGGIGGSKGGGTAPSKGGGISGTGSGKSGSGPSIPIKSPSGSTSNVRSYGSGSTKVFIIPSGQPFAGRSTGGGTRNNIFGTRQYGSGYPGTGTASVLGRGFPFGFWPITFGVAAGLVVDSELHSHEYGDPNNSSRPGGPLYDAPFQPPDGSNTYRILTDNSTVQSLIKSIVSNCSLSTTSIVAVPFNDSDPFQPKPAQVIQYYRSSSIALTLDGYNNSALFSEDSNAPNTLLPQNLNMTFLTCLNETIGAAAPLEDSTILGAQVSGLLVLAWMSLYLIRWFS